MKLLGTVNKVKLWYIKKRDLRFRILKQLKVPDE